MSGPKPRHARPSLTRLRLLVLAVCVAVLLAIATMASAAINEGPGRGNPDTNPAGHCPPGQNTDTSPGGLNKCD